MPGIARPIDAEASASADEALYEAHKNDRRPNALYDAAGNRKKLSATDPKQEALRQEWRDYYNGALDDREAPPPEDAPPARKPRGKRGGKSGKNSSQESAASPPANNNFGGAVRDCRPLYKITIALRPKPYIEDAPEEWLAPPDDTLYAYMHFKAEITDGPKDDYLDGSGFVAYDEIPQGPCSIRFPEFYDEARVAIKALIAGY